MNAQLTPQSRCSGDAGKDDTKRPGTPAPPTWVRQTQPAAPPDARTTRREDPPQPADEPGYGHGV